MNRRALSKRERFQVLERDGFQCRYCGSAAPMVVLHVDHVISVADGGTNDINNLVASCSDCNLGKSRYSVSLTHAAASSHQLRFYRLMEAVTDAHAEAFYQEHFGEQARLEEVALEIHGTDHNEFLEAFEKELIREDPEEYPDGEECP